MLAFRSRLCAASGGLPDNGSQTGAGGESGAVRPEGGVVVVEEAVGVRQPESGVGRGPGPGGQPEDDANAVEDDGDDAPEKMGGLKLDNDQGAVDDPRLDDLSATRQL